MSKPFTVNTNRFDPYKAYRFLVYFTPSTTPVAGVSKVGSIKRSSDVIEYKEGGNPVILKGLGRTKYEPITLERGITFDSDFQDWANSAQVLDKGSPSTSLKYLRKEILIVLLRVPGPAGPGCRRKRRRVGARQAGKRGLGTRHVADGTRRAVSRHTLVSGNPS